MTLSAMELQLEVFWFMPTTHAKTKQTKCTRNLHAPAAFHTYLSSRSDCSRCRWHRHLMNHGYFDLKKKQNTPNWNLKPGGNDIDSWISVLKKVPKVFGNVIQTIWISHKNVHHIMQLYFNSGRERKKPGQQTGTSKTERLPVCYDRLWSCAQWSRWNSWQYTATSSSVHKG